MRVGIIGCGLVSQKHINSLQNIADVVFDSVCDINKDLAIRIAARYGIPRVYESVSRMLKDSALDIVHVLTPPQTHHDLSIEAMKAGCHVLVEKPMSLNKEEAHKMIKVAERHGVQLSICHNFLFEPAFLTARQLIASGKLGNLQSVEIFWRILREGSHDRYQETQWIHNLAGGIFHEVAAHPVYLLMTLLGNLKLISSICLSGTKNRLKDSNELRALFRGEQGLGEFAISLDARPYQKELRIYGTKMSLLIDFTTNSVVRLIPKGRGKISKALLNIDRSFQLLSQTFFNAMRIVSGRINYGHDTLIRSFYQSLRTNELPSVTGKDGKNVVTVLDAMWEQLGWSQSQ
jgi:predicted dehydrogenase